jgi:glucose/arabinose dehydrogenase/cytochrome c2
MSTLLSRLPLCLILVCFVSCVNQPKASSPGEAIFLQRCAVCHAAGTGNGQGPSLAGLMGRKAASVPGFPYSAALKASGITWDGKSLDRFLAAPSAAVPGTLMVLAVPDATERKDLIRYLASLGSAAKRPLAPAKPLPANLTQPPPAPPAVLTGKAAFGDYRADGPGVRRHFTVADLPPPGASESAHNPPDVTQQPAGFALHAPPGFSVELFAKGLEDPRLMRTAPNGDIFVAESAAGRVRVLRAADGANQPATMEIFARGLDHPFGIAFYPPGPNPTMVYVANTNSVAKFPYKVGDLKATGPGNTIIPQLTHGAAGHWTRDIGFSRDGKRMFVSVGSASNDAETVGQIPVTELPKFEAAYARGSTWGSEEWRADVLSFDPDGQNRHVYATGIRNCVGLAVHPVTGDVWCSTNERDGLGDNLVPDYITRVHEGGFYGWPWFYLGANQDPRHKGERADLAGQITVPDVLVQAHSASLEMTFYDGAMFPAEYQGNVFAALHGSWNRALRTGYKVVRAIVKDGVPTGEYEDFLTGFVVNDDFVWGRPVGVTVAHDGALLVSEDGNGTIWRVSYSAKPAEKKE